MTTGNSVERAVAEEIHRFHAALVDWFRGQMAAGDFDGRIAAALHPDFVWVSPSGALVTCGALLDALHAGHGSNPAFRIEVGEVQVILDASDVVVASYVERQQGARNAPPENARRSTVIFEKRPRLLWRHLHETYL